MTGTTLPPIKIFIVGGGGLYPLLYRGGALYPQHLYGGGARSTPLFQSHAVFGCFYNWELTNVVFFSKRPPPTSKKSGYNHKKSKFQGVAPQYSVFFLYWGGPSPLVSRQVGFCANISKKSGYNHKRSKFQGVAPQYSVFFHYWGGPTPLISRQVGFFCQEGPRFYHDINAEKNRPPSYNNSA